MVLSADHGEMLGSHGRMSKNVWYEESIHIPLYIRQKGHLAPGRYPELFASPDHMPTLLGLLDIPVPDTCQGFNHASCIRGEESQAPQDAFLCSYPGMPEMVAAFEKKGMNSKCYGWRGIRTHRHTYVVNNGYAPDGHQVRLLYDNEKDPYRDAPCSNHRAESGSGKGLRKAVKRISGYATGPLPFIKQGSRRNYEQKKTGYFYYDRYPENRYAGLLWQ